MIQSVWVEAAADVPLNVTFGRRTSHVRQEGCEKSCIVCELEKWIAMTRDIIAAARDLLLLHDVLGFRSANMNELLGVIKARRRQSGKGDGWIRGETTSQFLCCGRGGDNDDVDDERRFPIHRISHHGKLTGGRKGRKKPLKKRYTKPS